MPTSSTVPPEVHAIFVSHAHADHAGYLDLVDPEIPVHVGAGTRALLGAIETSTRMKYGTHPWKVFADRAPIKVGGIEVIPFPVDHSIPFAYGFIVRTREGTLAYSGDFRHHGPRAADTLAFFDAVRREGVDALLIEGTRAGPDPRRNLSEEGVRRSVDRVLSSERGLAFACTYPRDLDRLTTLYAAAQAADRELVVSVRTAHLLAEIAPRFPAGTLPMPGTSPGLRVYARKKRTSYLWERPYLDAALSAADVRTDGAQYLLMLELSHFAELVDLRPPKGSPFIHSMSEPFSEDDVDDHVMHNWLDALRPHVPPDARERPRLRPGAHRDHPGNRREDRVSHPHDPPRGARVGRTVRPSAGAREGLPHRPRPLSSAAERLRPRQALGGRWCPTGCRPGSPRSTASSAAGSRPTR